MSTNPLNDISKVYLNRIAVESSHKKLDPVGQEDADIDNDGDTDKTDEYLHNRRKVRGAAIAKKKKSVKEGFSNWRQDLAEVMTDVESAKKIKEKKVQNKIKINPNISEAVEEIGGTLLEMVEIDEFDFIVEGAYLELLDEGYSEDEVEDALEYALTEAKVTFGHDTAAKPEKKKASLLATAREKLSGAKTAAKAAVARGARKVAKGALGVARKMEGGKEAPKTAERKPSTYRGAGAGSKERVSSGSYTPPTKKKVEKPSDPWEGSATTPPKEKLKAKAKPAPKKTAAPKAKAPTRKKKASKLDALLSDIRSESVEINEMPYQVMGSPDGGKEKKIGKPVKSRKYADARAAELADTHKKTGGKYHSQYVEEIQLDEKALSRAQQRFMGMVYAAKKGEMPASPEVAKAAAGMSEKEAKKFAKTKHKGLPEKKVSEQAEQEVSNNADNKIDKKKEMMDRQRLANLKMLQMKKQQMERQKLQLQKSGKLPLEAD